MQLLFLFLALLGSIFAILFFAAESLTRWYEKRVFKAIRKEVTSALRRPTRRRRLQVDRTRIHKLNRDTHALAHLSSLQKKSLAEIEAQNRSIREASEPLQDLLYQLDSYHKKTNLVRLSVKEIERTVRRISRYGHSIEERFDFSCYNKLQNPLGAAPVSIPPLSADCVNPTLDAPLDAAPPHQDDILETDCLDASSVPEAVTPLVESTPVQDDQVDAPPSEAVALSVQDTPAQNDQTELLFEETQPTQQEIAEYIVPDLPQNLFDDQQLLDDDLLAETGLNATEDLFDDVLSIQNEAPEHTIANTSQIPYDSPQPDQDSALRNTVSNETFSTNDAQPIPAYTSANVISNAFQHPFVNVQPGPEVAMSSETGESTNAFGLVLTEEDEEDGWTPEVCAEFKAAIEENASAQHSDPQIPASHASAPETSAMDWDNVQPSPIQPSVSQDTGISDGVTAMDEDFDMTDGNTFPDSSNDEFNSATSINTKHKPTGTHTGQVHQLLNDASDTQPNDTEMAGNSFLESAKIVTPPEPMLPATIQPPPTTQNPPPHSPEVFSQPEHRVEVVDSKPKAGQFILPSGTGGISSFTIPAATPIFKFKPSDASQSTATTGSPFAFSLDFGNTCSQPSEVFSTQTKTPTKTVPAVDGGLLGSVLGSITEGKEREHQTVNKYKTNQTPSPTTTPVSNNAGPGSTSIFREMLNARKASKNPTPAQSASSFTTPVPRRSTPDPASVFSGAAPKTGPIPGEGLFGSKTSTGQASPSSEVKPPVSARHVIGSKPTMLRLRSAKALPAIKRGGMQRAKPRFRSEKPVSQGQPPTPSTIVNQNEQDLSAREEHLLGQFEDGQQNPDEKAALGHDVSVVIDLSDQDESGRTIEELKALGKPKAKMRVRWAMDTD